MIVLKFKCLLNADDFKLYTDLSRLEYASPVWSPHLIKDIDAIEKVQRRFTNSFPNLRDLPYPIRIARLNIIPLTERRSNIDLITSYRILNNLVHHTSFQFFTLRTHNLTRGHSLILSKPKVRLNVSKLSFYSRVVDPWNLIALSQQAHCPASSNSYSKHYIFSSLYYTILEGREHITLVLYT